MRKKEVKEEKKFIKKLLSKGKGIKTEEALLAHLDKVIKRFQKYADEQTEPKVKQLDVRDVDELLDFKKLYLLNKKKAGVYLRAMNIIPREEIPDGIYYSLTTDLKKGHKSYNEIDR